MLGRYGASVSRVEVEWGRACDPALLERALTREGADLVAMVHAETSTGVLNPVADLCAIARRHGALTIVDAVTSLGAHPVEVARWEADACYSCTQKGLGAPSGLSPIVFSANARRLRTKAPATAQTTPASRSFYFDLSLLEDYWLRKKYHHTISAPLIYALREALVGSMKKASKSDGSVTAAITQRSHRDSKSSASSCCLHHSSDSGRSTPSLFRTASMRHLSEDDCSKTSTLRSGPASAH
jgi:alanine-glyoxylate transaminase/serine-glyoxylate transaminase/serine-pyruvate transaminase